jgi:hypothetical protein
VPPLNDLPAPLMTAQYIVVILYLIHGGHYFLRAFEY